MFRTKPKPPAPLPELHVVCDLCDNRAACPTCKGGSFIERPDRTTALCPTCSGSGTCPHCFAAVLRRAFAKARVNGN